MKTSAKVKIHFPDSKRLDVVWRALEPEVRKPTSLRSRENLVKDGEFLVLRVEAKDTVALRAALNAYLRWINSMMEVLGVLEDIRIACRFV
jgi:tRNA threonylcarbamoyladenosine modification (KEOPS) complex  Pcc1 subunit